MQVLKDQKFMQTCHSAIIQNACGQNIFTSTNVEFQRFNKHFLETFLPSFANSQMVESSIKDTVTIQTTGREEETRSLIAMVRSCMLEPVKSLTKSDPEYTSRIRKKENSKEDLSNKTHIKHVIKDTLSCFSTNVDPNEAESCKNLLEKDRYCRNECLERFENAFDITQLTPREPTPRQKPSGVAHKPFLLGKV